MFSHASFKNEFNLATSMPLRDKCKAAIRNVDLEGLLVELLEEHTENEKRDRKGEANDSSSSHEGTDKDNEDAFWNKARLHPAQFKSQ